jgi:molybdenum cofactor synthesis domain-containing protein
VSLLAEESIASMRRQGLDLPPGSFGENLVTAGIALDGIEPGRRLRLGSRAVVQVTQLGKECHAPCAIFELAGDCIMQSAGLFARVRRGGAVRPGDLIATDPELDVIRYAVVTLSDRGAAGERGDASGDLACEILDRSLGGRLVARELLPDDIEEIRRVLARLSDEEICDLVVTTGGTGLSPRDVTPDATLGVIDRQIPGMAEAMRAAGMASTPRAMLSRAVCGQRGETLIVNLSGSPRAVQEQLGAILPALGHAVQTASGLPQDCGR